MTVKLRLVILGGVAIAGILLTALLGNYAVSRYEYMANIKEDVDHIEIYMLSLRKNEKDFMLRREDKYIKGHKEEYVKLQDVVELVSNHADELGAKTEKQLALNLKTALEQYKKNFDKLVELQIINGLNENEGLQGEFRKAVHNLEENIKGMDVILLRDVLTLRRNEKDFLLRMDAKYIETFDNNLRTAKENMFNVKADEAKKKEILILLDAYQQSFHKLTANYKEIGLKAEEGMQGLMRSAAQEADIINEKIDKEANLLVEAELSKIKSILLMLSGLLCFAVSVLVWLIVGSVIRPIGKLQTAILEIEQTGDLRTRADVNSKDEIGQVAQALNGFFAGLEGVLEDVKKVMTGVSQGDLTGRVVAESKLVAEIKYSINNSLESIGKALREVSDNVRQVAAATAQASTAIGQISDSAQGQFNAVRQVAVGIDQTARAVEEVSESAKISSDKAKESVALVKDGQSRIEDLRESVTSIAQNAKKISSITGVIGQIAAQTNMLSLNAAIEAARAGEAGKGFAVVAEEVGKLAANSGKSVGEINDLIAKADSETSRGVEVTRVVGLSIERIAQGAYDSEKMAQAIAAAMEQQSAAVIEIRASVEELSRIGEANASASEEISATMDELARIAAQTNNEVGRFRF